MSVDYNLELAISPLACAISSHYESAEFLLRKGANPNGCYIFEKDTFLGRAAANPTSDMLNLLVQYGARLQGSHALRQAAQYRRIGNMKRLLELGVDINEIFTRLGSRPTTDSPTEMVRFPLEHGAQTNALEGDGNTPLQVAKQAGRRDIIQVFREFGIQD
ncbi:ankyrin repeat-containing domain protein [Tricladium varicosporioides]|nr:ankyrin repeat-containing domain protein [Hymenoscyphus varicosporioides]